MTKRHLGGVDSERGYDAWAPTYESMPNATRDLAASVLREVLSGMAANAVLEVGCGTGLNTGWLVERFGAVTALDASAGMLEVAKQKHGAAEVEFRRHDIREPWPLADSRFDLAVTTLVLEHIGDLAPVYREAARVLRPGGSLFLCELHPFRQLKGGQAQYLIDDGQSVPIRAHLHGLSDYVNGGLAAGLHIERIGEWSGEGDETPRVLSLLFGR